MIFFSWNCRGLASKPKKLALKELSQRHNPNVLMLQETLGTSEEVLSSLKSLLQGWHFQVVDSIGHSGGLATGIKGGRLKLLNLWGMKHALSMEVQSPEFGFPLMILNIYGPCQGRASFWNELLSKSVMRNHNLVIGGDLNFSIGNAETWGPSAKADSLSYFFMNALISHNLIDVNLIKLRPTWRNCRMGEARIAKKLDRFLLCEDLASRIPTFRQWVGEGGNSYHFPILMQLSKPPPKRATPFKLNPTWLQEESFNKLFKET